MKRMSKWLTIALIAMLMGMVLPGMGLAQDREKMKDIERHWARNNVLNLRLEGIINGYPDGTYRPEASVTTTEVVVMAVKLLGLDADAKAKADAQLVFSDEKNIPGWARGYVAVAVDKGLIDGTGKFQPMKKATRLDVTILLVKTLNAEIVINNNNAAVKFTDVNNLSQSNQQYIALGVLNDLIKGYDDKSFQPNKPVTRAEMATLFARLQDQVGTDLEKRRIAGSLLAVNSTAAKLTVATSAYLPNVDYAVYNDGSNSLRVYEFAVNSGAPVFRDNKSAVLSDLKAGDGVTVLLNVYNAAIYVNANSVVPEKSVVEGQVKKVDAANRTIRLYQHGIVDVDYTVAQSAYISRNGVGVNLDQIVTGDWVKMERDSSGTVIKIEAKSYDLAVGEFDAIKIKIEGPDFKIKMEQNRRGQAKVEIKKAAAAKSSAALITALDNDDEDEDEPEDDSAVKRQQNQDLREKEKEHREDLDEDKEAGKGKNNVVVSLSGDEAREYIRKFVEDAKIGETISSDQIIAAAEKILGSTVDKTQVEIEIELKSGQRELEFEF